MSARKKFASGFALIEVLIAVTIASGAMIVVVAATNKSLIFARTTLRNYQAALAVEETIEAVKAVRATGWSNIASPSAGQEYGISWNGAAWQIAAAPETTTLGFTRSLVFEDVYRDANDDIAASGTLDAGTRKITITVEWTDRSTAKSQEVIFYLADVL